MLLNCLVHIYHNVCEEVRTHYKNVNQLISEMKKTFSKCSKIIPILKENPLRLPNPPRSVSIRYGSRINAVKYDYANCNKLKSTIEWFKNDSECVKVVKNFLKFDTR